MSLPPRHEQHTQQLLGQHKRQPSPQDSKDSVQYCMLMVLHADGKLVTYLAHDVSGPWHYVIRSADDVTGPWRTM